MLFGQVASVGNTPLAVAVVKYLLPLFILKTNTPPTVPKPIIAVSSIVIFLTMKTLFYEKLNFKQYTYLFIRFLTTHITSSVFRGTCPVSLALIALFLCHLISTSHIALTNYSSAASFICRLYIIPTNVFFSFLSFPKTAV